MDVRECGRETFGGYAGVASKFIAFLSFRGCICILQGILHTISRFQPLMHSFQGALPHLPLPSLKGTMERVDIVFDVNLTLVQHLKSMRPITTDEEYARLCTLTDEFLSGVGPRLQRYLMLKSWLSPNYVSDFRYKHFALFKFMFKMSMANFTDYRLVGGVCVLARTHSDYDQQQLLRIGWL
jgi:hypothetical protein